MDLTKKNTLRQKRMWRIRKKVQGSTLRPRLCVHFSNKHIYAQAIDDDLGKTLVSVSSLDKDIKEQKLKPNKASSEILGKIFAEKAVASGITKVVYDRNGRIYHGTVKSFAEAARKFGLQF
ncbi:MAG: 50S ribosomal protein L18 [Verrucomicrobiota bacterium]|nr:50S ribosomal protein L18 [Verrucomicrobiota bacterium]